MKPQPLTEEEFARLSALLERLGKKCSMNLEQLDGFLAALVCGPDTVLPNEYLSEILGDNTALDEPLMRDFLSMILRHWNAIADALHLDNLDNMYLPLLLEDENGVAHANDWAGGFLRGMDLRRPEWSRLLDDEQHAGLLVPIFALAHEHDPDPEMRPYRDPPSTELREKLIVGAAAGVIGIYRHFASQRSREMQSLRDTTVRRIAPKIGRNDPCPCGSGRKFKQCCGGTTLH
jgi:uncharacterized protein